MNRRNKKENAITLIALVVTIVVLLILAGVSISMLTGENGIINQAKKAKENTRGANVAEQVSLWKTNKKTDEYTGNQTAETLDELIEKLVKNNLLTENEKDQILGNSEKGIEATGKITIDSKTIVFIEPEIKIGDYIDYEMDYNQDGNTGNDWRLFYRDENNVYLIASDYVEIAGLTEERQEGYPIVQLSRVANSHDEAIQFLLNKSYWTNQLGNNVSEYVIGAPTMELFANSWNKKYPEQKIYLVEGEKGINAGYEENPTSVSFSQDGDIDNLYYVDRDAGGGAGVRGMWIASKAGDNGYIIRTVHSSCTGFFDDYSGYLPAYPSTERHIGIRPIICLKKEVEIILDEGTIENPHQLEYKSSDGSGSSSNSGSGSGSSSNSGSAT